MEVLIPKSSGFCPGVKRAEDLVFALREKEKSVNLYGPLIHNQNYINYLDQHGIRDVDINSLSEGEHLVVRTHGIDQELEKSLAKKFVIKDLTCPIVKRVQKHIENASHKGAFVIISGKPNHAEIKGLVSYAKFVQVIETDEDREYFLNNYKNIVPSECNYLYVLSQTTYSRAFFEQLVLSIQEKITEFPIEVKNTICAVTENKEQESLRLQEETDFTIVIGDPHSSNSKKLYKMLAEKTEQIIFTQDLNHLKKEKKSWEGIEKILLVSSTSTPRFIEKEIEEYLQDL